MQNFNITHARNVPKSMLSLDKYSHRCYYRSMRIIDRYLSPRGIPQVFNAFLRVDILLALILFVFAALMIAEITRLSYHGYDFTDEGYYLHSLSTPWEYKYNMTMFGIIYHPFSRLFDGNIVYLRIFCQLSVIILGLLAALTAVLKIQKGRLTWASCGFVVAVALSTYSAFSWGLITPSYNTLNFSGILVAFIGLQLAGNGPGKTSLVGWACLALGGWLVFMAKPTSAAALFVVAAVYLFATRKFNLRLAACCLFISLVLVLVSGGIFGIGVFDYQRYGIIYDMMVALEGGLRRACPAAICDRYFPAPMVTDFPGHHDNGAGLQHCVLSYRVTEVHWPVAIFCTVSCRGVDDHREG